MKRALIYSIKLSILLLCSNCSKDSYGGFFTPFKNDEMNYYNQGYCTDEEEMEAVAKQESTKVYSEFR